MLVWFVAIARARACTGSLAHPGGAGGGQPVARGRASSCRDGVRGFLVLGAVVLVVTGGEALYADMGHFGKRPIRLAWFAVVLPALLLNYFGQGGAAADRSGGGRATRSTRWCRAGRCIPMVVLATAAAVVASQALISGAFSLTQQAVQLGYCPRVTIVHTSHDRDRADLHARGEPAAGGRLRACWCWPSGARAQPGAAPTASRSPARWRSPRCSSAWWRATAGAGRGWQVAGARRPLFLVVDLAFLGANTGQDRRRAAGSRW